MNPSEMVQWAVGYTLEVVEERLAVLGRRVLRHWYAGCALIAEGKRDRDTNVLGLAETCACQADAMLAALDATEKEERT